MKHTEYLFLVYVFLVTLIKSSQGNGYLGKIALLRRLTNPDIYDSKGKPKPDGSGPVEVSVKVTLRDITSVKTEDENYFSVEIIIHTMWYDDRLKYDDSKKNIPYLYVTNDINIWIPDLTVDEKTVLVSPKFHYAKIFPDGQVENHSRMTVNIPPQKQTISLSSITIRLVSYSYAENEVKYTWNQNTALYVDPLFYLESHSTDYNVRDDYRLSNCISSGFGHIGSRKTGNYSCLQITFSLERQTVLYTALIYIPSCVYVMLSWIPFWMDKRSVLQRAVLLFAILLHLAVQKASIVTEIILLEQVRILSLWTDWCLVFAITALVETVLIFQIYYWNEKKYENNPKEISMVRFPLIEEEENVQETQEEGQIATRFGCGILRKWLNKFPSTTDKIDFFARFTFPFAFILFALIFYFFARNR